MCDGGWSSSLKRRACRHPDAKVRVKRESGPWLGATKRAKRRAQRCSSDGVDDAEAPAAAYAYRCSLQVSIFSTTFLVNAWACFLSLAADEPRSLPAC